MSIGREDYAERRESRIERLESRAAAAQAESTAAYEAAHSIMEHIPAGQPILVGHHSERHHRRDLDRIDRNMRKSVEADKRQATMLPVLKLPPTILPLAAMIRRP